MKSLAVTATAFAALLGAVVAAAQSHDHAAMTKAGAGQSGDHAAMMAAAGAAGLREPGQATFGAIAEIVVALEADPATDWSKVNVDALRHHLVDMDNVFQRSRVTTTPVPGGARFAIAGDSADVRASIERMVRAHTAMIGGSGGKRVAVAEAPGGLALTVTGADAAAEAKIRGLGFFGLMTEGDHHRPHHLMMAKGQGPH